MSRTPARLLAAAAVATAMLLAPGLPAQAGFDPRFLISEGTGNRVEPEFTFGPEGEEPTCFDPVATIFFGGGEGGGDDPSTLDPDDVIEFGSPLSGTFRPGAAAPAGFYELEIFCEGAVPESYSIEFAFARLTIDKVVKGTPPAGTTFTVEAVCDPGVEEAEPLTEERTFASAGGSATVILYDGAVCTVTETDDGGATSSTITDGTTNFLAEPLDLTTTVTNVFAAVTPAPTPPGAAQPVVAPPAFTG
jgi:hypothetical protein